MQYDAWHGTTQVNAKSIRNKGFNRSEVDFNNTSIRNPNDLGGGVYFFIDSRYSEGRKMAEKYAHKYRNEIAKQQRCQIEVINVSIKIEDDYLLDLDDDDTSDLFIKFQKEHERQRSRVVNNLRNDGASRRKNYDGIMVELFARHINKQLPDGSIQTVLKDTITIFDNIISNFPNGKELCVREMDCIKIKDEEKDYGNEFKKFL